MPNHERGPEERLYFIIRSWVMGQIGGSMFLFIVFLVGAVDYIQAFIIGTFGFVLSLALSRVLDSLIDKFVVKILNFLNRHNRCKKIILKYF